MRHGRFQTFGQRSYATSSVGQPVVSVITKRVDPEFQAEYQDWQARMNQAVSQQAGFLSFQNQVSEEDETLKLVILSFKSQDEIMAWIESDVRRKLLKEADKFHKLTSLQQIDTSAWGMLTMKAAPPIWKNILVVFSALYPTITFTRTVIEPFLAPLLSALIPEVKGLAMVGITCIIMNTFSMKTAFAVIGPRFFPPDTPFRTAVKVVVLLAWAGIIVAVQIPEMRSVVLSAVSVASDACVQYFKD